MTNEQTFDIYLVKNKSFDLYINKEQTFDIYLVKNKTFDISIYKINMIDRYIISFISRFTTSVNSNLLVNGTTNMSIGKFNVIVNPKDFRDAVPYFISHLPIIIKAKMLMEGAFLSSNKFNIAMNSSIKLNGTSTIRSTIGMVCTPHVRAYYTLGDHDTKTLAEMDALTLAGLDYHDL